MEQKIKALKTSSNVISVISKIGYTVMIVAVGICAALLIFLAVTGGEISALTVGGTNVIFFDEAAFAPAELTAVCAVLIVMSSFFLAIFLLAYRMFHEISLTGKPFSEKYARAVRAIGILTAAMPVAIGAAESAVSLLSKTEIPEMYTEAPGIVVGLIIFCLSYIIDYGCGLEEKSVADSDADKEE